MREKIHCKKIKKLQLTIKIKKERREYFNLKKGTRNNVVTERKQSRKQNKAKKTINQLTP